ncbi:hypothetical protein Tco_1263679 [Tanacetum coccineum]
MMRAASTPTHHPLLSPTPSPPLILPSTAHKDDLPEADMPLQKRACFTAPTPRRFEVGESSVAAGQPRSTMAHRDDVRRRESEEFYTQHQDTQDDCVALSNEVGTLRRYLSSLCTTHEQERVEARQALDRSEAHNRTLEARIVVLETRAYRHEWQRQDADDHATRAIMRVHVLEARARIDTLKDTGSSA